MGTLDYYDSDPEGYSDSTFGNDMSGIRRVFAGYLDRGDRILDLGCGSGRDTLAFRAAGFDVVPVDGSEGMCRVAERNIGTPVRRLLFRDLDYSGEFDGVWACASLLHLGDDELVSVMGLIRRALRDGGVLYASFKLGDFAGFRDGRYYRDMTPDSVRGLAGRTGFQVERVWLNRDGRGTEWVNSIMLREP